MSGDYSSIPLILATAQKVISEGLICDNCLGRQFAKLSTGLTNRDRGAAIRLVLAMAADVDAGAFTGAVADVADNTVHQTFCGDLRLPECCWVCNGLFEDEVLDLWASRALSILETIEYETFLVGTRLSGLLSENEELLWEVVGTDYAEPLKSEVNREVGKRIASRTGKEVNFTEPDVLLLLDLARETVESRIKPTYIYGRYQKLVRGIPQTRWYCRECRGAGCKLCNFTGQIASESVEELIAVRAVEAARAAGAKFHGAGREDADARMLGEGRPFVLELIEPRKRTLDLSTLASEINAYCKEKVVVSDLRFVDPKTVGELKSGRHDKVYLATIACAGVDRDTLAWGLGDITCTIQQRTPSRVVHRRADLVRKRRVYAAALESFSDSDGSAVIRIECEAGLYVKELISGDSGRTVPSLAEVVGSDVTVTALDVVAVLEKV